MIEGRTIRLASYVSEIVAGPQRKRRIHTSETNFWLHLSSPPSPLPLQSICFVPLVRLFADRSFGNFTVDAFVAFVPLALRKHVLRRINIGRVQIRRE